MGVGGASSAKARVFSVPVIRGTNIDQVCVCGVLMFLPEDDRCSCPGHNSTEALVHWKEIVTVYRHILFTVPKNFCGVFISCCTGAQHVTPDEVIYN